MKRIALLFALSTSCATTSKHTRFDTLTPKEKGARMKTSVLPEMKKIFDEHYAEDSQMKCESCHGDNADDVAWKMPNDLPAFDPHHMPDPNEEMARFMTKEVTPKMSALLGEQATCFTCHPQKKTGGAHE